MTKVGLWLASMAASFALMGMVARAADPVQPPIPAAVLTGTVTAPAKLVAARVTADNLTLNIAYTTYTDHGRYRLVGLFPGTYAITVTKAGFAAPPETLEVAAAPVRKDIALKTAPIVPTYVNGAFVKADAQVTPYDQLYPAGPGREVFERTCKVCHGVNFIGRIPQARAGWEAAINYMTKAPAFAGVGGTAPMIDPAWLSAADREVLLDYFAKNFGPDKPPRVVQQDEEPVLDEAALGRSQFVEYHFANTADHPHRWTQETHFDHQGNVWVSERGSVPGLVRLNPRTGVYTDFKDPNPKGSPHGLTVDVDDTVWWGGKNVHLGHLDPKTGKMDRYLVKQLGWHGHTPVLDTKGDIWFSMLPGNKIGHWTRATGALKLYDSPVEGGRPYGFIIDRHDKIWFVQYHRCAVVNFDPATETFTSYHTPSCPASLRRLGIDAKGDIWYGVYGSKVKYGKIGRLDVKTGKMTEYVIPIAYSQPYDTWADPSDNIWVSTDNYLVKFDAKTAKSVIYPMPERTDQPKLSSTGQGAIWYTPRMGALTSGVQAGAGVLYPDKDKITTFAALYGPNDTANLTHGHTIAPYPVVGQDIGKTVGGANIGSTENRPAGMVTD